VHYLGRRIPWSWEPLESVVPPANDSGTAEARGYLSRSAVRLLATLEIGSGVPSLAKAFPHVLNHLAEVWQHPQATEACFDELLLPSRNGRNGFGHQALRELLALRDHHNRRLARSTQTVSMPVDEWRG
jgi:hypothetical protein